MISICLTITMTVLQTSNILLTNAKIFIVVVNKDVNTFIVEQITQMEVDAYVVQF